MIPSQTNFYFYSIEADENQHIETFKAKFRLILAIARVFSGDLNMETDDPIILEAQRVHNSTMKTLKALINWKN